jgi:hypothetical protein
MNRTIAEQLDPHHHMRHSRTEWRVAKYPRIVPPPEGKGKRKLTRRQRKAAR